MARPTLNADALAPQLDAPLLPPSPKATAAAAAEPPPSPSAAVAHPYFPAPAEQEAPAPAPVPAPPEPEQDEPTPSAVRFSTYQLPGRRDADCPLPLGALVSPFAQLSPAPPLLRRVPVLCGRCRASVNLYSRVEDGEWRCVFCGECNAWADAAHAQAHPDHYPELARHGVDFACAGEEAQAPPQPVTRRGPDPDSQGVVFVVDGTLPKARLHELAESAREVLAALPATALVGLVVYTGVVSVYEVGVLGSASADVYAGVSAPDRHDRRAVLRHERQPPVAGGEYLSPVHFAGDNVVRILDSLRGGADSARLAARRRRRQQRRRRHNGDGDGDEAEEDTHTVEARSRRRPARRALGAGAAYALLLLQSHQLASGRLVVCAGGAPNFGPGSAPSTPEAKEFFETLGRQAVGFRVGVDVFCSAHEAVCVPALHALAAPSGGRVLLLGDLGPALAASLVPLLALPAAPCVFRVRVSPGLRVTRIIGATAGLLADDDVRAAPESVSVLLGRVDPSSALAVYFALDDDDEDFPHEFAHFQFEAAFTDSRGTRNTRVVTHRLRVTGATDAATVLAGQDEDVVLALAAKRFVLDAAGFGGALPAAEVAADLDGFVAQLVDYCGVREGASASRLYSFPHGCAALPRRLFHLRRGPLLGAVLGHDDAKDAQRALFLRSGLRACQTMVCPRLLGVRGAEPAAAFELPLDTLSLWSDAVLFLDQWTELVVWSGTAVAGPHGDAAREAARAAARDAMRGRLPRPPLVECVEGSSAARALTCRLAPAHRDSPQQQLADFPFLGTFPPEELKALRAKLARAASDDASFNKWFWRVVSSR